MGSGHHGLAKNIYQAVIASGEKSPQAYFQMGQCYETEGQLEAAQSNYEEAIAFKPTYEYHHKLSVLLIKNKKDAQAAEVLERSAYLKDVTAHQKFEIYKTCGNCWTRSNQFEQAEKAYKKALEMMPNADEIRANLGTLCLQANRIHESRRHFQDAIASNPRNHQALAGLGSCSLKDGNTKGAHDYFAQSLQVELNNPNALFHLVKCAYELKSYATAANYLLEYIQNAPVNPNLLYSLAGLQFHLGRIEEAKSTTAQILTMQPTHTGAQELMGLIGKYSLTPLERD